jgi:protein SCO1/2
MARCGRLGEPRFPRLANGAGSFSNARMINRHQFTAAVALAILLTTGCQPRQQTFAVKGIVEEIKPDGRTVIIDHEEIPGYMPAMSMPFRVKNTNELNGVKPRDILQFRMVVTEDDGWIEDLTRLGVAPPTNAAQLNRTFRRVREVEPLNVGDAMPDNTFTNELGKVVRLADFQGSAYAFTFIFTRCPFPIYCPRMAENFQTVARQLKADRAAPTNWHLLSITFDVDYDTPERLRAYAQRYNYDPARWSFLTGALIDIDAITEQLGLVFPRSEAGIGFDHNLRTVVVDATGRVHRIFLGNEWKAEELTAALKEAAGVTKRQP